MRGGQWAYTMYLKRFLKLRMNNFPRFGEFHIPPLRPGVEPSPGRVGVNYFQIKRNLFEGNKDDIFWRKELKDTIK